MSRIKGCAPFLDARVPSSWATRFQAGAQSIDNGRFDWNEARSKTKIMQSTPLLVQNLKAVIQTKTQVSSIWSNHVKFSSTKRRYFNSMTNDLKHRGLFAKVHIRCSVRQDWVWLSNGKTVGIRVKGRRKRVKRKFYKSVKKSSVSCVLFVKKTRQFSCIAM